MTVICRWPKNGQVTEAMELIHALRTAFDRGNETIRVVGGVMGSRPGRAVIG